MGDKLPMPHGPLAAGQRQRRPDSFPKEPLVSRETWASQGWEAQGACPVGILRSEGKPAPIHGRVRIPAPEQPACAQAVGAAA